MKKEMSLILLIVLFGCGNKNPLVMKTVNATNNSKDSVISNYDKSYLEIKLSAYDKGDYWKAMNELANEYKSKTDYQFKWEILCTPNGADIIFKNPNEFLNFMAEHGYQMDNQVKKEWSVTYVFKRE